MRNNRPSPATCDALEPRRLLAGNVTATIVNGDLVITGDSQHNRIIIEGGPVHTDNQVIDVEPEIIIRPADDTTTINGSPIGHGFDLNSQPITGSIRVHLGAKADQLLVDGLATGNRLIVNGGKHGDTILIRDSSLGAGLTLAGGHGDDSLTVLNTVVGGAANIAGESGHDLINLDLAKFNGNVAANGGRGNDVLSVNSSTFNAGKTIDGDRGKDKIVTGVNVNTSFAAGNAQGWQAGFADYPVGEESFYELESGIRDLPAELGAGKGFYLSGNNHSDDLFMFLKRKLGTAQGLKANTEYLVRFDITFGSSVPTGCGGIGGSPGESVYLKAGASAAEPNRKVDEENHYRMTIDKGNQAQSGRDASNVGNIDNGQDCETAGQDPDYKAVRKTHVHTTRVKTDAQGNMWLIVGTDSGFEGTTSLYMQSINVRLVALS
jgi:hypothetical protein